MESTLICKQGNAVMEESHCGNRIRMLAMVLLVRLQACLRQTFLVFRYYRRRIVVMVVGLVAVSLVFCSAAFAKDATEPSKLLYKALDMVDDITDTKELEDINELVAVRFGDTDMKVGGVTIRGLNGTLSAINNICQNIAVLIAVITFCIGYASAMAQGQNYLEIMAKRFLGLVVCLALIANAMTICFFLANIGTGLAEAVMDYAKLDSSEGDYAERVQEIKDAMYAECTKEPVELEGWHPVKQGLENFSTKMDNHLVTPFSYILAFLFPWLIQKAVWVIVKFICWGRAVEIIILACLSPLAMCNIANGHGMGNGNAERFLRQFGAVCIQGAIILVTLYICSQLQVSVFAASLVEGTDPDTLGNTCWNMVAISLVMAGLSSRSQGIAQKLMALQ